MAYMYNVDYAFSPHCSEKIVDFKVMVTPADAVCAHMPFLLLEKLTSQPTSLQATTCLWSCSNSFSGEI